MQTPINSRDLTLQALQTRVLDYNQNRIVLTCPVQQFKYGTDNVAQPATSVVTATLLGILQGTVTFSTTGFSTAPTTNDNTLTINPDNMTGDVATINASLTYLGITYTAVAYTVSKIFNALSVKLTRNVDLLPAYTDGSGYTLPTVNNYVELYNGDTKLTAGVTYGPATQTINGLTATVNSTTGLITLSQTAANTWTGNTASFTFTATRALIPYNITYTITKAKQGVGGQQLAEAYLYQWSTAQPATPTGTSVYTWTTQQHVYSGTDTWSTTVSATPGGAVKLWKITKALTSEASLTSSTVTFSWAGGTIRQITTEANELIKTASPTIYASALNLVSLPALQGSSDYNWSGKAIQAIPQSQVVVPTGWSTTQPASSPGFTVYQASVNIIDAQSTSLTRIEWSNASILAISYAGTTGVPGITAVLTNDTHAIPTDSTGANANYGNSGTDLFIYEGSSPLVYDGSGTTTGKFTVTAAVDGVTAGAATVVTVNGATGVRYADLTASTFDKTATGSITFTITGRRLSVEPGQTNGTAFTYTVKQSFTKTPSGVQGDPGNVFWLTSSTAVVQTTIGGIFNPSTITFRGKKTVGNTTSDYTGYFIVYRNDVAIDINYSPLSSYIYTIPAGTTSVRAELYSDSAHSPSNLLDTETVPVVSDGKTGISSRRAYIVVPSTITPASTPASTPTTGNSTYPTSGTWFTSNSNNISWTVNWTANAPNSISEGYTLYQSDGSYDSTLATPATTWNPPYISSLKVGNLAAISINTGGLKVSDYIKGGSAENLTTGDGFYVDSNGHLRVGSAGGAQLKYDTNGLAITDNSGNSIFTVVSNANTNATTALQTAGSVTWLGDPSVQIVSGTQLKKIPYTGYANEAWDSHRYSKESYVGGAYASFTLYNPGHVMLGLNSDPALNSSYTNIDHAWYIDGANLVRIYENGVGQNFDIAAPYHFSYTSQVLSVIYDGRYVKYYRDGDLIRTIEKGANLKFYVDSSFYDNNTEISSVRFGPVGAQGGKGDNGISYWLVTNVAAINKSSSGSFSPPYVNGTIKKNDGTTITDFAGYFKIYNNGVLVYTSANAETSKLYNFTSVANTSGVEIIAYSDSGLTKLIGSLFVPVVTDGANSVVPGPTGPRGSLQGYGSKYGIYSNAWANNLASRVIYNMINNYNDTLVLDYYLHLQRGDTVTLTNSAGTASFTRFWDGTDFIDPKVIIDGNLLVTGTVGANKLASNFLEANWATIGTLKSAQSGSRVEIKSDVIKVYEGETLRVRIGNLSA